MMSRKDNGKRRSNYPPPKTNGHDLRRAIEWIVNGGIFAAVRLHGNVKWTPFGLVCLAIFWVWSSQSGLVEAAKDAIGMVANLFGQGAVAVSSYQTLTAALVRSGNSSFEEKIISVFSSRSEISGASIGD